MAHHTDYNADELLKGLGEKPGVRGYLVYNQDGVPIKMHNSIKPDDAIHYASLFSELWNASKRIITKGTDNVVEVIRLRTTHQTEFIVSQIDNYTLVCEQYCGPVIKDKPAAGAPVEGGEKKDAEKKAATEAA